MAFITDRRLYYKVMPFRLKNVGATYQRLINEMFKSQIGRNIEVCVDDILVKHMMKLNSSKCAFRVSARKFLMFMASQRGIEVNPKKVKAVVDMQPPKNTKEVQ